MLQCTGFAPSVRSGYVTGAGCVRDGRQDTNKRIVITFFLGSGDQFDHVSQEAGKLFASAALPFDGIAGCSI